MEDTLLFTLDLAVSSSHPSYLFEEMILAMNMLQCSQPLHQLYFRRNTGRGAKHSSKNGKLRNLEWYQVFCVNKASHGQGRKFECNK